MVNESGNPMEIDDYICSRASLIKGLEVKFDKSIRILEIENLDKGQKKYTFRIGSDLILKITNTDKGLLIALLKLSLEPDNACKYCNCLKTEDVCLIKQLGHGSISTAKLAHKLDKKLLVSSKKRTPKGQGALCY